MGILITIEKLIERKILIKESTSEQEIEDLFRIVERDIQDAKTATLSLDWQFGIAYNAALKLTTIVIRSNGYRLKKIGGFHQTTISLIPLLLGEEYREFKIYLDSCRKLRNKVEYDSVGGATVENVKELFDFIDEFKNVIQTYN